jgi:probable phosphoglycerate mutase
MTFFYIVRHGETDDNANGIFQGQSGRGLNRRGQAQAARLAERLRRTRIDAIVSSDLERAVETAAILGSACDRTPALDPGLREVDVGTWTGKSHDAIAALYPEEWAAWSSGLDVRRGGGETYAELAERVELAIGRIASAHDASHRIVLVSHGGAIKSTIARLLGVSREGLRALAGTANASLTVVERDLRGRSRIHAWNDTAHLEGLTASEETD